MQYLPQRTQNMYRKIFYTAGILMTWYAGVIGIDVPSLEVRADQIAVHAQNIEKELAWNKRKRDALSLSTFVAAVALAAHACYTFYYQSPSTVVREAAPVQSMNVWKWLLGECKQFVKSASKRIIESVVILSVSEKLYGTMQSVYHPGNLAWFVHTHTTILQLLAQIKQYAHIIDHKEEYTSDQLQHVINLLALESTVFIKQAEALLGFMTYKKQQWHQEHAMVYAIDQKIQYIKSQVNELGMVIETALQQHNQEKKSIVPVEPVVALFMADLEQHIVHFSQIDTNAGWITNNA
jgi:hypothetical protein